MQISAVRSRLLAGCWIPRVFFCQLPLCFSTLWKHLIRIVDDFLWVPLFPYFFLSLISSRDSPLLHVATVWACCWECPCSSCPWDTCCTFRLVRSVSSSFDPSIPSGFHHSHRCWALFLRLACGRRFPSRSSELLHCTFLRLLSVFEWECWPLPRRLLSPGSSRWWVFWVLFPFWVVHFLWQLRRWDIFKTIFRRVSAYESIFLLFVCSLCSSCNILWSNVVFRPLPSCVVRISPSAVCITASISSPRAPSILSLDCPSWSTFSFP